MIPREHLPLTLVTVALVGFLFMLYRELNALNRTVAQLSIPAPASTKPRVITGSLASHALPAPEKKMDAEDAGESSGSESEGDETVQFKESVYKKPATTNSSILKSSKEKTSATA